MGRDPEANHAARERTQQRLRHAALELLAEHGVRGTSMAALAERAGVSKGLAYHYFPNKRALVEAVVRDRLHEIRALVAGVPDEAPPAERLGAYARSAIEANETAPDRFRLLLRALTDPALRELAAEVVPESQSGFADVFRELGAADPDLEARFFQVALLGILTQAATSPRPTPAARLVDRLLQAVTQESA